MPDPTIIGSAVSAGGGIIGTAINAIQNRIARNEYYQHEAWKADYNSIPNQLQQWKQAGLNPNSFGGNFQPVTGTPPQPNSLGDTVARSLSAAGNLWQQKELARLNFEVEQSKLRLERDRLDIAKGDAQMRKEIHSWNLKSAEQAWNRGQYGLAKDILDYAFATSTQESRIQKFNDEAAITSEYARRYPEYLAETLTNIRERNQSLRHGRKIADQRLVFDRERHYDDENYRYTRMAQDDEHFGRNFGLRSEQFQHTKEYHSMYLEYLEHQAQMAYEAKQFDRFFEYTNKINQLTGYKSPAGFRFYK